MTTATVPFEVVRRTEYVFEPFMGSLIQLPEAMTQFRQNTEFFLAQPLEQAKNAAASGDAEVGEKLVWEWQAAHPQGAIQSEIPNAAAAQNAAPLAKPQQARNMKVAKEEERPRFYQPQIVRFFDPVAAAAEGEEGADPEEQIGPRPSNELPAELKAAIWQIDEQFRQRQKEQKQKEQEKPAKEAKRGFLRSRSAKRGEVEETQDHIRSIEIAAATRGTRWEEMAAPEPTAWVEVRPTAALSAPMAEPREAVALPVREPELPQLAAPLVESLPIAGQSAAVLAETSLSVEPQTVAAVEILPDPGQTISVVENVLAAVEELMAPAVETPTTVAQLTPPVVESLQTTDQNAAPVVPLAAIAEHVTAPLLQGEAIQKQRTAPAIEKAAAPAVVNGAPRTTRSAKAKQTTLQPPSQMDERVKATAAAISQVRPSDLRAQWGGWYAQTPIAEEAPKIAKEKPRKTKEKAKISLAMRFQKHAMSFQNWLLGEGESNDDAANQASRRRAERIVIQGMVAFYWSGGTPRPHEIVNISRTGFYLKTTELWSVETLVRMTLQKPGSDRRSKRESVSVLARVVRMDEGGVGHEFVTTEALMHSRSLDVMPSHGTNWRELDKFLEVG